MLRLRSLARPLALAVLAGGGVALAPGLARAQQPRTRADSARLDSARTSLGRVKITAGRAPTTVGATGAVELAVDSLRLTPAAPLEEVLRELPFVLVRQNSRGEAELSVRGSDSRQAAVLFDGLPLTIGWDHRSDPSVIPMSGVGTVVMVRGLSSLLQGPNALGGVIDLGMSSYRGQRLSEAAVGLRMGTDQLGTQAYQLDVAKPFTVNGGEFTLRAGGGYRSRPAVALSRDLRDPYTTDAHRRTNSDLDQRDGFVSARYQTNAGAWLGASYSGYGLDRGVMPELHIQAPRFWRYPEQTRRLALVTAGTGRRRTFLGSGDIEVVVGRNSSYTSIESFFNSQYDSIVGTETGDERTTTARVLVDHSLGRGELRSAFTLSTVRYFEVLDGAAVSEYEQKLWSSALEVEQPLLGSLRVTGGYALDASTTPLTAGRESLGRLSTWGARLGMSSLAFGGNWRLHASANRRARFAALRELYSGALNRFEPNPTLRPEVLVGGEVGATLLSSRVQFQSVFFNHRLSDAVVRTTLPNRKFKRVNRDEIRSAGLELLGGYAIGRLSLSADALIQHVRIKDPAVTGTDRKPENQPALRLGSDALFPLFGGLRGRVSVNHSGTQYCVNPDTQRNEPLQAQTWAGVGVERGFTLRGGGLLSRLLASISFDNLTDAGVFDQCGLPQPGRTIRLGVALT